MTIYQQFLAHMYNNVNRCQLYVYQLKSLNNKLL